jgi:hypothetical protein
MLQTARCMIAESSTSPTFVFRATDRDGARETVQVAAASASAARYRLEIQGFCDPELIEDTLAENVTRAIDNPSVWEGMTTAERIDFQEKCVGPGATWHLISQTIKSEWWIMLALAAGVWWRTTGVKPFGFWSLTIYAVVLGWLWLHIKGWRTLALYNRLQVAKNWERWSVAQALVEKLRSSNAGIPEFDLVFTEAKVLAARGELAAALEKVRPIEEEPAINSGLFRGLLSGVHETARDFPGSIRCLEEQLALDPKAPASLIDLAFAVAFRAQDFARASELLAQVEDADIVPMARGHVGLTRALIAGHRGDRAAAEAELQTAEQYSLNTAGDPSHNGMAMLIRSHRAIALRHLGRRDEAEKLFAEVEPWLLATREHTVLEQWRRAGETAR